MSHEPIRSHLSPSTQRTLKTTHLVRSNRRIQMNSSNLSFLLLTIALVFVTLPANEALNLELLTDACSSCTDVPRCVEILKSDPTTAEADNIKKLAKATLQMCLERGKEAQLKVLEILKENRNAAIEQCANFFYDGTVGSFKSALGELSLDIETANYDSKVASDGPTGCDRALRSAGVHNPAVTALNDEIKMLSHIAFSVTNKLSIAQEED